MRVDGSCTEVKYYYFYYVNYVLEAVYYVIVVAYINEIELIGF